MSERICARLAQVVWFSWMHWRAMGGDGSCSMTLISSKEVLGVSEDGSRERASATTFSSPLGYFKVAPYSFKASRCQRSRPEVNLMDGWMIFSWSV